MVMVMTHGTIMIGIMVVLSIIMAAAVAVYVEAECSPTVHVTTLLITMLAVIEILQVVQVSSAVRAQLVWLHREVRIALHAVPETMEVQPILMEHSVVRVL